MLGLTHRLSGSGVPCMDRDCGARAEQVYKSGVWGGGGGGCKLTPEIGWSRPRQEKPVLGCSGKLEQPGQHVQV